MRTSAAKSKTPADKSGQGEGLKPGIIYGHSLGTTHYSSHEMNENNLNTATARCAEFE